VQSTVLQHKVRDVNEARSVRGRGHKVEAEAKCYEAEAECYEAEAEARVISNKCTY